MKKKLLLLPMILMTMVMAAQTSPADTNYTTRISSVKWMPDGKALLLGIVKHHKKDQQAPFFSKVFLFTIGTNQLTYLFEDGRNLTTSPDGNTIAFTRRSDKISSDIYFYNMVTRKSKLFTSDSLGKYGLTWPPDGRKLAYNITRSGSKKTTGVDIFITDIATKKVRQITQSGTHASYDPQWSPDSKHLVYYFEKGDSRDQIWLTDAGGSFHRNLTNDTSTHNYYPSFISDKTIIYTRSPEQLMMMHTDGGHPQKIEGINATPVRYNDKAGLIAYIKSEEENKLVLYDWQKKTTTEVLDGTKLLEQF